MDIPHLVREQLGDEEVVATVSLGDEDAVCVTPVRTLVYRGEGLLSDESVASFPHDIERFDVSEGRRKTKFIFEYVDGTETFTVPESRTETVLALLLQGILRVAGVADSGESVAGVFRFSELTLVITESRLVKHVGTSVWDDDFEVFDYDDVTGLDFEEGSVATQVILTVGGRPQRIKAPTDEAPQVKQTLTQTLCAHYGVDSLAELEELLGDEPEPAQAQQERDHDDLELDDGISPLVDDGTDAAGAGGAVSDVGGSIESGADAGTGRRAGSSPGAGAGADGRADGSTEGESGSVADDPLTGGYGADGTESDGRDAGEPTAEAATMGGIDPEDIETIQERLSTLATAVQRQNELLRRHDERIDEQAATIAAHDETIEQLIEELRRGR